MPNKNRRGNWVGCQRLAGLAVVAVAVAVDAHGAGLAVELAVDMAVALGARSLVVGVMVKKKRHRMCWQSLDSVDAVAKVCWNHFHWQSLTQSTPLVLQLCQRLDARLLDKCTYTSPPPLRRVQQLCQLCPWAWLDQLCGCLRRQQLRQRLEPFFCCLSRQLEHLVCSCLCR